MQSKTSTWWHDKYSTNLTPKPFLPPVLIAHFEYSKPSKNCRQRRPGTNLASFLGHSQIISHGCKMKSSRNEAKTGAVLSFRKAHVCMVTFSGFFCDLIPPGLSLGIRNEKPFAAKNKQVSVWDHDKWADRGRYSIPLKKLKHRLIPKTKQQPLTNHLYGIVTVSRVQKFT